MRWVVAFWGSRDRYEAAAALAERDCLERLVTDLYLPYWSVDPLRYVGRRFGVRFLERAANRSHPKVPIRRVDLASGCANALPMQDRSNHARNQRLGSRAASVANRRGSGLLAYSYYAPAAAATLASDSPLVIFQVHPSPRQVSEVMDNLRRTEPMLAAEPEEMLSDDELEHYDRALSRASAVICTSAFVAAGLEQQGVERSKLRIVPYGVTSEIREQPTANCPADERLHIGWLGQAIPRKGFSTLIQALEKTKDRPITLHLIGRFPPSVRINELPNLRVVRTGEVSSRRRFSELAGLDILVAPSLLEGYGLAIHEALAVGTPVLGTPNSMLAEFKGSAAVRLVEPGDPDELANAIADLDYDYLRQSDVRERAQRLVADRTWPSFRASIARAVQDV